MQVKVMVWACFTGERLNPLIIYNDREIDTNKYKDILYDKLFSLINDLLELLENSRTIQVADKNTLIFMQDNILYYKATYILKFLTKNKVPIIL